MREIVPIILGFILLVATILVIFEIKKGSNTPNYTSKTQNVESSSSNTSSNRNGQYLSGSPVSANFLTIHGIETNTQHMRPIRKALIQYFIPPHYDARIKYGRQNIPNSSGIMGCISDPLDQGNCGSSWAFAVSGVISDRLRIQSSVPSSYGMVLRHDNLSPNYLMSHGNQCSQLRVLMKSETGVSNCSPLSTCQKGTPILAFDFVQKDGCIGMRNDADPDNPAVDVYKIGEFYSACLDIGGEMNYYFFPGQRQMRAESRWTYTENNKNCMKEIMERGPLVSCMNIYSDFLEKYKYGMKNDDVYYQPPGSIPKENFETESGVKYLGTQAVSIIGWGEKKFYSETIEYWIVRFTWGTDWNGDGYAKIIRNQNCCNIELEMLGCWDYEILSSLRYGENERDPFDVTLLNTPKAPKVLLDA